MYCPPAEGRHSSIVVVGEKARAQLVRDQRTKIVATIQDVNKLRITYAQVGTGAKCVDLWAALSIVEDRAPSSLIVRWPHGEGAQRGAWDHLLKGV